MPASSARTINASGNVRLTSAQVQFPLRHYQHKIVSHYCVMKFSTGLGWWLLAFSSLVVFAAVADGFVKSNGYWGWAIACGVISFVIASLMVAAKFVAALGKLQDFEMYVAGFMSIWWAAGVGSNTSANGPGRFVGNVYYFSWLCLFCSIFILYMNLAEKAGLDVIEKMQGGQTAPKVESSSPIDDI